MPADFNVRIPVEVRWGDMDSYGHVNNAVYFTYCESGRMRYFEAIDLASYREDESHGPAVVTAECQFLRQVHYPSHLEVGARATKVGRSSFTLEYVIRRKDDGTGDAADEVVATGSSVVVWVDYASGQSTPLPDALKEKLRAFDGL